MPINVLRTCSACEASINLGCGKSDERPFDRIMHCLLPVYPVLALAAERQPSGFTCLVGQEKAIYPFIDALFTFDVTRFGFVPNERYNRTACVPLPDLVITSGLVPTATRLVHRSVRMQIGPIQAWPPPPAKRQLLLLVRGRATSTSCATSRSFVDADGVFSRLSQRLHGTHVVVRHYGSEPIREQLRLFANSSSVVGIHGAGLANLVFNVEPVCVVEISTYMSSELQGDGHGVGRGQGSSLWRTNAFAAFDWNGANVRWQSYRVPINQLVSHGVPMDEDEEAGDVHRNVTARSSKVNGLLHLLENLRVVHGGGKFDKRDRYVKKLGFTLYEHDLDNIASAVGSCSAGVATSPHYSQRLSASEMDTQRTSAEVINATNEASVTQAQHTRATARFTALNYDFI